MKIIKLFLVTALIGSLNACVSNSVSQPSRTQVQAECSQHYAHIGDEFSRASKIKECMRSRGAL